MIYRIIHSEEITHMRIFHFTITIFTFQCSFIRYEKNDKGVFSLRLDNKTFFTIMAKLLHVV